jgi:hypothetical protein
VALYGQVLQVQPGWLPSLAQAGTFFLIAEEGRSAVGYARLRQDPPAGVHQRNTKTFELCGCTRLKEALEWHRRRVDEGQP